MTGPIRGLIHAVCRQRWLVAGATAAAVAAGAAASALSPALYRAEATIALSPAATASPGERRAGLEAQAALFLRPEIQQPAVAALGPAGLYPRLGDGMAATAATDAALAALGQDLRVGVDAEKSVLRLAFEHPDPDIAAQTVNHLLAVWRRERQGLVESEPVDALSERLEAARAELARQREELAGLRQDSRRSAAEEERQLLLRQRARLENRLRETELQIAEQSRRLETLEAELAATPERVPLDSPGEPPKVLEDARQRLFQLQLREKELLGKYKESSVLVRRVRDEIAHVERLLAELESDLGARNTGPNPQYRQLSSDASATRTALEALQGRRQGLEEQMAALDEETAALAQRHERIKELEAAVADGEARVEALAERLGEARSARAAGLGVPMRLEWVREAQLPQAPARPRPVRESVAAGGVGLLLGALLALLAERLSPRVSTPRALERRLDLPVLASLAEHKG